VLTPNPHSVRYSNDAHSRPAPEYQFPQHFSHFDPRGIRFAQVEHEDQGQKIQDVTFKEKRDETATRLDTSVDLARRYRDVVLGGRKDTAN